ncbi:alpha/beta fold hydrolase [Vibrio sp. SM6]|uniref:Alpha/beta fold hydrolase n=1 Tax=Vibrio agarilyticus TaxID=2726741 RepID=A0A7X8TRB4_9VIBR|nr:alpha/beta fold hydrolase [Vibrio agarilyticus]NLS13445.1 alpha/beta fold hydrolase [Vibrio agarilyticus]
MNYHLMFGLILTLLLSACAHSPEHPLLQSSEPQYPTEYESFAQYRHQAYQMVKRHRYFLTANYDQELAANVPYQVMPNAVAKKGVLLIHGLGDSPFSFVDISNRLAQEGFLVRTVLLQGHGTRPGDLLDVDHQAWQTLVAKQVELLKTEVEDVYLGGFSTGANLAYLHAAHDPDIQGLMLFSPAFKSNEPLASLVSLIKPFRTWLQDATPEKATNYARYAMTPTNGFAEYQETSEKSLNQIEHAPFSPPVFMVLSQHDSVLDSRFIRNAFNERFTHPKNRLIWYGSRPSTVKGRTRFINSAMPERRITNMSHMGVLFAPSNPYYGEAGSQRICRNHSGETAAQDQRYCEAGNPVWYSAWDGHDGVHVHARLTYNPQFDLMMDDLVDVFTKPSDL